MPRSRLARHAIWAIALLTALGCSPVSRLRARFALPDGVPLLPGRLHVRARAACASYAQEHDAGSWKPPSAPAPGLEEDPNDAGLGALADAGDAAADDAGSPPSWVRDRSLEHVVAPTLTGLDAEVSVRASSCWVAVTAWYDANGNSVVDADEPLATIPATLVNDRGLCVGNLTTVGPIVLKPAR